MKDHSSSKHKLHEMIYWCTMCALTVFPLTFSAYYFTEFSLLQAVVLAAAFPVAIIINRFIFKVPATKTFVSAKELIVFWGILWLGLPGGITLAVAAMLGEITDFRKLSDRWWLLRVFANTSASLVAALVFYLTLSTMAGFTNSVVAKNPVGVGPLLFATCLMAISHMALVFSFSTTYLGVSAGYSVSELVRRNFAWTAATYVLSSAAALFFHFLFIRFGLEFGLVILPIVVSAYIVYRIFMRKLADKTLEIRESSRIHQATVEALATAIDARDQVGVGHVRRTQIYAVGIGEILGLPSDEISALTAGALLHGIGKLAVPDNILNKPGRLTPAEMEKMKAHITVGASIIEHVKFPYPVVPTVMYHRERWDGTGYPKGLKKEEIPLTARILAVADAYDTLRGERPYRSANSREETRRILQNDSGKQFDPKVVDVFLRNLGQFERQAAEKGFPYLNDLSTEDQMAALKTAGPNFVDQIKRANREVFTLYELARVFSSSLNLEETLELFTDKIKELVPYETCAIYLLDESETFATAVHTKGRNRRALENKRIRWGEGATGYVLQERKSVSNINPALDFSFDNLEFIEDYTAMASIPLLADDKLCGAVSIYSCTLDNYGEEHLRLLEMVSHIASDAISMSLRHAESETRALTDPMTGLPNARSLQFEFEKEVARAERTGSNFQLLMLDLDGFKAVNDTFGHKTGDRMLKEIARILQEQLREYDFLARYAGDEFIAIVPETNNAGIQELCQRMESAVVNFKLPIDDGRIAHVGVSVGASCYPMDGETIDQIIIAADKKMYSVKAERKVKQTLPVFVDSLRPGQILKAEMEEEENFVVELDESHIVSAAIN